LFLKIVFPCFFYLTMVLRKCRGPAGGGVSPALPLNGVCRRRASPLRPGGNTECFAHLGGFFFLVLLTPLALAACPADSLRSPPDSVKAARLIDGIRPSSIGGDCLAQIVDALDRGHGTRSAAAVLRLIGKWSDKNQFSFDLLYRCTGAKGDRIYPGLPGRIVSLWEEKNGPVRAAIAGQEACGGFAREDSLFTVLDRAAVLSADELLQWAHVQEVVDGYDRPPVLYGRALAGDPAKLDVVCWKLFLWLENAPADSITHSLSIFQKSALHERKVDTIGLQNRLADFYGRHDLYDAETEVLTCIPETRSRLAGRLCDLAGHALSRGFYAAAVAPAGVAYALGDKAVRSAAAEIVCRAYEGVHMPDSALVWLDRGGVATESSRIEAITLDQVTGRLAAAAALIGALQPTLARDTLRLRQRLFEGDIAGAADAVNKGVAWAQTPNETTLWTARTLLFRGDIDRLSALLDSVLPEPSWRGAQEILRDRLLVAQLRNSNAALAAWSRLEYNLFIDKPEVAAAQIPGAEAEYRIPLLLRIVKEQLERGRIGMAEALFEKQGDTVDSPEYLYLRAATLLRLHAVENRERALALLRRIIRDFPDDVFSERARVLLSGAASGK